MSQIRPPNRTAVLVAVASADAARLVDPFDPAERLGTALLRSVGRSEFPSERVLGRVALRSKRTGNMNTRWDPIALSEGARKCAAEIGDRDVIAIGREVAEAFGIPKSVPMFAWWPSWVLGPGRLVLVLADPCVGKSALKIEGAVKMREVLESAWGVQP